MSHGPRRGVVRNRLAVIARPDRRERGDIDEPAQAGGVRLGGGEEVLGPLRVDRKELRGITRLHEARNMDDGVHAAHGGVERGTVLDGARGKFNPW